MSQRSDAAPFRVSSRGIALWNEFVIMMTYSFDKAPIYASGNAAAAWAVAGLLFTLLIFA